MAHKKWMTILLSSIIGNYFRLCSIFNSFYCFGLVCLCNVSNICSSFKRFMSKFSCIFTVFSFYYISCSSLESSTNCAKSFEHAIVNCSQSVNCSFSNILNIIVIFMWLNLLSSLRWADLISDFSSNCFSTLD